MPDKDIPLDPYPGLYLSDAQRRLIDQYALDMEDVTIDLLVHSLASQIEKNFQRFFSVLETACGKDAAVAAVERMGHEYGGGGYKKYLQSHGLENGGSPQTMARYQDLMHVIRGPKHTSALFAEVDDERCVVKRRECIYWSEEHPENGRYTAAFEHGCFEGYKQADPNLREVEVVECLWKGDGQCELHWVFDMSRYDMPIQEGDSD